LLFKSCSESCVYDYYDIIYNRRSAYEWSTRSKCYRYTTYSQGFCFRSVDYKYVYPQIVQRAKKFCRPQTAPPTVSPTPEFCNEKRAWSEEIVGEITSNKCDTFYNHKIDYGVRTCSSSRSHGLRFSIANSLFKSCSESCVYDYYDIIHNRRSAYEWETRSKCYRYNTDSNGFCFRSVDYKYFYPQIVVRAKELCRPQTALPTVSPTPDPESCIEKRAWSEEIAGEITSNECDSCCYKHKIDYGVRTCSSSSHDRLRFSIANLLFNSCSEYCVYDYYDIINNRRSAYKWETRAKCYRYTTDPHSYCFRSVTNYPQIVVRAKELCQSAQQSPQRPVTSGSPTDRPSSPPTPAPSTHLPTRSPTDSPTRPPTPSPTDLPTPLLPTSSPTRCIEKREWTKDVALINCPKDISKIFGVNSCRLRYQKRLDLSLANRLYKNCRSKCVYDYSSIIRGDRAAYKYSRRRDCYVRKTKGTCFSERFRSAYEIAKERAKKLC